MVEETASRALTDRIETVTASDFNERTLHAQGPVAVEFMSYGCGHSRVIKPVLQKVAVSASMDLIFGERRVAGSLTGNPATGDATLSFSALGAVSPMIETVPLGQAAAAYAKMMAGKARCRMVVLTKYGADQTAH